MTETVTTLKIFGENEFSIIMHVFYIWFQKVLNKERKDINVAVDLLMARQIDMDIDADVKMSSNYIYIFLLVLKYVPGSVHKYRANAWSLNIYMNNMGYFIPSRI